MYLIFRFICKSVIIFYGLFIILISNKISFEFMLPNKNKYIVFDKISYFKCVHSIIKQLGFSYVILGFLNIIGINIYFFIVILPALLILLLNKKLSKFYKKII